jgi:hypothetical protein
MRRPILSDFENVKWWQHDLNRQQRVQMVGQL